MYFTNGSNEGGHHQGNDDALQHVEEQLPDELHVHRLPLTPRLLPGILKSQPKPDTWRTNLLSNALFSIGISRE